IGIGIRTLTIIYDGPVCFSTDEIDSVKHATRDHSTEKCRLPVILDGKTLYFSVGNQSKAVTILIKKLKLALDRSVFQHHGSKTVLLITAIYRVQLNMS